MLPIATVQGVKNGISTGMIIDLSDYLKKTEGVTKDEFTSLENTVSGKLDTEPQHKHDISDVKDLREELDSKYDTSKKYPHNVILSDTEKIAYIESPKVQRLEVAMNSAVDGYNFYVDDSNGDLMIVSPSSTLIATYSIASNSWNFGGVNINDVTTHQEVLENHTEALTAVCHATLVNINDIKETNTKVAAVETRIDEHIPQSNASITNHQEVLENHTEALTAVCHATLVNINDITETNTKITSVESIINDYIAKTNAVLKNHYDALLALCEKHGMVDSNTGDGDQITPN